MSAEPYCVLTDDKNVGHRRHDRCQDRTVEVNAEEHC